MRLIVTALSGIFCSALSLTCAVADDFPCTLDSACSVAGPDALCASPGYCAVPDETCPSGHRFVEESPRRIAGQCVENQGNMESSSGESTEPSTSTTQGPPEDPKPDVATDGGSDDTTTSTGGEPDGSTCGQPSCPCTREIAVGPAYACGLREDGLVGCWGSNDYGELGTGEATALPLTTPQLMMLGSDQVSDLDAGYWHTCARTELGDVWCWGRNSAGQVNPEDTTDPMPPRRMDQVVEARFIASGANFTCAALLSDELSCWGANSHGQLGVDDPAFVGFSTTPLRPEVRGLSAGRHHVCYWTEQDVYCRGRNARGQLGRSMIESWSSSFEVVSLSGTPTSVLAAEQHTCAILESGPSSQVWCWGNNADGQLTDAAQGERSEAPVSISLPDQVRRLAGSRNVLCALTANEALYCWGSQFGETLGLVTSDGEPLTEGSIVDVPSRSLPFESLREPVSRIEVGAQFACALTELGTLWCWGSNGSGQLGPVAPPLGEATRVDLGSECGT